MSLSSKVLSRNSAFVVKEATRRENLASRGGMNFFFLLLYALLLTSYHFLLHLATTITINNTIIL